jgi:hypothetical protein
LIEILGANKEGTRSTARHRHWRFSKACGEQTLDASSGRCD